jgi:hypothetical protein
MALLRCLVKRHGLRRVYCEGMTDQDLPNHRKKVAALRAMEREEIPALREQLEEVRA